MLKKWILTLAIPVMIGGCATRDYVHSYIHEYVKPLSTRADAAEGRIAVTESDISTHKANLQRTDEVIAEVKVTLRVHADRLAKNETDIAQWSKTAQAALERANSAEKLAEGKLIYEVVLSDDKLKFPANKTELRDEAHAALDEFIANLKAEAKNVYIEIQGHTDNSGTQAFNMTLGEARAEAVKRYLNINGGIPLHRMSTISYGESAPLTNNRTKEARQQNRRVVLVVIQ